MTREAEILKVLKPYAAAFHHSPDDTPYPDFRVDLSISSAT